MTLSKRWRISLPDRELSYTSEAKLYAALNDTATRVAEVGVKFDVHHFENGRWVLWERGVITEEGWRDA